MSTDRVRRILIVGGSVTGWMTAAALVQALKGPNAVPVHVVEVPPAPDDVLLDATIASLPSLRSFHRILGIAEGDLLRATQGTFRLGTQLGDWATPGSSYFHPFGELGAPLESIAFHQHWLRAREEGDWAIDAYSLTAVAAQMGRFAPPSADPRSVLSTLDYGYHLDGDLYAAYLRRYAMARGVGSIAGEVVDVRMRSESGFVDAVVLNSGERIEADLFIDCTGSRGLLIDQALHAGYEDWTHWLPCDRAITVPSASAGDPLPYTRATAHSAGWQWRIPLQHRIDNGYVYSSRHSTDAEAVRTLLAKVEGETLADPRPLRFTAGRRKEFWIGNCVAIGSAASVMEPLESTHAHLIQSGIAKLLALFPWRDHVAALNHEYNRLVGEELERIRDLLILHYRLSSRSEGLWQSCRSGDLPASLARRLAVFERCGRIVLYDEDTFQQSSWISVLVGQRFLPKRHGPIADTVDAAHLRRQLARMRAAIDAAARTLPRHADFLQRHLSN